MYYKFINKMKIYNIVQLVESFISTLSNLLIEKTVNILLFKSNNKYSYLIIKK